MKHMAPHHGPGRSQRTSRVTPKGTRPQRRRPGPRSDHPSAPRHLVALPAQEESAQEESARRAAAPGTLTSVPPAGGVEARSGDDALGRRSTLSALSAGERPPLRTQQLRHLRTACRLAAAALVVLAVLLAGVVPGGGRLAGAGFWALHPVGLAIGAVVLVIAAGVGGASRLFADWAGQN